MSCSPCSLRLGSDFHEESLMAADGDVFKEGGDMILRRVGRDKEKGM